MKSDVEMGDRVGVGDDGDISGKGHPGGLDW